MALEVDEDDAPVSSETWQICTASSSISPESLGRSLAAILTLAVAMMEEGGESDGSPSEDVVQVWLRLCMFSRVRSHGRAVT